MGKHETFPLFLSRSGKAAPDLTGKRYGKLVAVSQTLRNGFRYWTCACDCGGSKEVRADALVHGRTTTCGCVVRIKDLRGKRFGSLVIDGEPETRDGMTFWPATCDCGTRKTYRASHLSDGTTSSCGCAKIVGLTGRVFRKLTVVGRDESRAAPGRMSNHWLCRCECGGETSVHTSSLHNGGTTSCGCTAEARKHDLAGKVFGDLTVIREATDVERFPWAKARTHWHCKCACGTDHVAIGYELVSGNTTSCGCGIYKFPTTHGLAYTRAYSSYRAMLARCYDPSHDAYRMYGARGIRVSDRWRFGEDGKSGVECFFADMGERPSDLHSIDRIEVNGDYTPGNCRWADRTIQVANKRRTIWVTAFGMKWTLAELARRMKVPYGSLLYRIRKLGMEPQAALANLGVRMAPEVIENPVRRNVLPSQASDAEGAAP